MNASDQETARSNLAPAQWGRVSLVGAGPGDPDLLTLKAARLLGQTQLVLFDNLVSPGVLSLIPADAERIYVGKKRRDHALPQEDIIALMVRLAQSGRSLVRLKGGDPYIFGRGGEEAQALVAAGVACETVPGISAAQGAAAYSGIPLTHRDHVATLVLATGHQQGDGTQPCETLDWAALARPRQTVVFYMGVTNLPIICTQLIAHGLPAATPAALVERATQPEQRTVVGTLQTLPDLSVRYGVRPPALIMVGETVGLQAHLGGVALRG